MVVVVVVKAAGWEEYAAEERRAREVTTEVARSCMVNYLGYGSKKVELLLVWR